MLPGLRVRNDMVGNEAVRVAGARLTVTYQLSGTEAEVREAARRICLDQTIEAPEELATRSIREEILGRIERLTRLGGRRYSATISYGAELVDGGECAQLLNVAFGMSSLRAGIRVSALELPEELRSQWPGPRYGLAGLRRLVGVPDRPLVCAVLKPLGLSPAALAELAARFVRGGVDLVKDDQGLLDQRCCPFEERVARCAAAVREAARARGRPCLYVAHVTGSSGRMQARARFAERAGAGGLLVCPGAVGFDALSELARDEALPLPILSHPGLLGGYTAEPLHGMAPAIVYGTLPRLAGADASLYPVYGAGYPIGAEDCRAVAKAARGPWEPLNPMFPSAAGRMALERVGEMCAFYGRDVLFILGSAIQNRRPSLESACRRFVDETARCAGA